MTAELLFV